MKKILIIRFRRIGDSVISSTLCSSLKQSIPDSEIHYILNEHIAPLFHNHPHIDKLITFSKEDMSSTLRYLGKVREIMTEGQYDIIIDTRSTIKTLPFSLFSLKTPYRIGRTKIYNRFIHNYRVNNSYDGKKDNVQLTLSLLEPLEKEIKIKYDPYFKLYATLQELSAYKSYMQSKGIDFSKPIIVCAVTARLAYKVWPKEYMKEVLQRIIDKYNDVQLIFNYGDAIERKACSELYNEMNRDKHIFIDIEANSLRELICLLANSNFFFGNEGGTRHISQALNIPSFAIYPPKIVKNNWLPNASGRFQGIELADINKSAATDKALSYQEKMVKIDVDSVWNKLIEILNNNI